MDGIEPAQLSFLSIYNPSLGKTEETEHDQIIYYYSSKASKAKRASRKTSLSAAETQHEERNEQMRQIGLAQGMVGFAKEFSDDKAVDYVDTEKARAWIHELEDGWWVVASVDLTRFETNSASNKTKADNGTDNTSKPTYEYSSRELCPQSLLREQFLRAHAIFLLHNGASLADIYARRGRQKLCAVLEKFWNRTLRQWDVLMRGNPATDIYNGMKLAAGGELGIGVGEEEWGSGERAVLEDLVQNTEGLVDVIVSRFGEPPAHDSKKPHEDPDVWLGSVKLPIAGDGVIFSGVGAISREAQRKVTAWMEWVVRYGLAAYGVQENPQSTRKKQRRAPALSRRESSMDARRPGAASQSRSPASLRRPTRIPPPLVSPYEEAKGSAQGMFDADTVMKYMTLGIYGSSWGIPAGRPSQTLMRSPSSQSLTREEKLKVNPNSGPSSNAPPTLEEKAATLAQTRPDVIRGCFIIGMQGDLHDSPTSDPDETPPEITLDTPGTQTDESAFSSTNNNDDDSAWDRRNQLRTLYIERATTPSSPAPSRHPSQTVTAIIDRLRVVVYARQPFLYTLLFDAAHQPNLAFPQFYRRLHAQLTPLHRPLLRTTSPSDVRRRIWDAASSAAAAGLPRTVAALGPSDPAAPIYDLVFDPGNGTCHTTLPNVPELGEVVEVSGAPWTRADAVAVHGLILRVWAETRRGGSELERTARTARGWWVVWMRLPGAEEEEEVRRERGREMGREREQQDLDRGRGNGRGTPSEVEGRSGSGGGGETTQWDGSVSGRESSGKESLAASGISQRTRPGDRPGSSAKPSSEFVQKPRQFREAFLVRRAPEKGQGTERRRPSSGIWGMGGAKRAGQQQQEAEDGRLAEGIGINPRKYIEGLLSLNR